MARRTYDKKLEGRDRNEQRIYALTLGQCSQALRNRMEAHNDWNDTDRRSSVIGLLTIVQVCMTLRQTRKHEVHSLFEAETTVFAYKQKLVSNHEYYEKFKDNVANAERLGSDIGQHMGRITTILNKTAADSSAPTIAERAAAQLTAKDEYLAICFIMNSDSRRYGGLIRDIENEHTRGTTSYTTLTGAYDYLVNYKASRLSSNDQDEGGLAFYNEDDPTGGGRGQHGGRGRGGREGRGRGNRGGRNGRGGGRGHTPAIDTSNGNDNGTRAPAEGDGTNNADQANAQFLLEHDNLDNEVTSYIDATGSCFQILENANRLDGNVLLIDSCSSVNLICNGKLLHDVVTVDWHMRVRCNAGVRTTNQQGKLGSFPEPVWYNPKGVANILSLNSVKRHYRVTYDSAGSDTFVVTDKDGLQLHFKPTKNGLYALRGPTSGEQKWSFLNTVSDKKDTYTKRELKSATRAREAQNIMMFPSTRQYMDIADQHLLKNNPVQRGPAVNGGSIVRRKDPSWSLIRIIVIRIIRIIVARNIGSRIIVVVTIPTIIIGVVVA
jgi:hypothetical protein